MNMTKSKSMLTVSAMALSTFFAMTVYYGGYPALAGSSNAQSALTAADANGDGTVTREEWAKKIRQTFSSLDKNGDNSISQSEIQNGFDILDTNHDGFIEPFESNSIVAEADTNGDGKVSREEFQAWAQKYGRPGGGHSSNLSRSQYESKQQQIFTGADIDQNGKIDTVHAPSKSFSLFNF